MNYYLQTIVDKVMHMEQSPRRLAASCSLGVFFACSPFLGIQTFLLIGVGMLLRLNIALAMITLYLINNPITMIPIIILDYFTGYFFISYLLGYNIQYDAPTFFSKIDAYIQRKLSTWAPTMQFSFAYYVFGGLLFATLCAFASYPLFYWWIKKLKERVE